MAVGTNPPFNMFKREPIRRGAQRINRLQGRLNGGALPADRIPRVSERLTGLQDKFRNPIENKLGRMDARLGKIQGRIDGGGLNEQQLARANERLGRVQGRRDRVSALLNPYGQQETPAPTTTPTPETTTPVDNSEYTNRINNYMKALFPQTDAYNLDKYLTAMEPARNYEEQRQTDSLAKYMAARGGRNSGFAAQKLQDQNAQIGADYNRLALDSANAARNRDQQNSERLRGLLTDEAERKMRGEQNNYDNRMRILENMLDMGKTLMGYGYDSAANSANITSDYGKTRAGMTANEYVGMPPMSAFPSGHTATPGFVPPFPSSPDMSNSGIASIVGNQQTSGNMFDSILDGVGMFDAMGGTDWLSGLFS